MAGILRWFTVDVCWSRNSKTTLTMSSTLRRQLRTRRLCSCRPRCTPSPSPPWPCPDLCIFNLQHQSQVGKKIISSLSLYLLTCVWWHDMFLFLSVAFPEGSTGFQITRHSLSYIQEVGNGWFGQVRFLLLLPYQSVVVKSLFFSTDSISPDRWSWVKSTRIPVAPEW